MLTEILLFFVFSLVTYSLYSYFQIDHDYFKRRNLKFTEQNVRILSILYGLFKGRTPMEFSHKIYNTFPDEAIYGLLINGKPRYVIRNPEIIKKLTIKDFDYFEDHLPFMDERVDKLWANSMFLMKGQKWRRMRSTMSPAFTGSKMRQMFELICDYSEDMIKQFRQQITTTTKGSKLSLEMEDLYTCCTNDIIMSCAFGLKIDSIKDRTNEFLMENKKMFNSSGVFAIKFFLGMLAPKVARAFNMELADSKRFMSLILDTMKYRKEHGIFRPDMINILMQVRDNTLSHQIEDDENEKNDSTKPFNVRDNNSVNGKSERTDWNDYEIVAQSFIFLIAGFSTTTTVLTFATYELVANPTIQQKLYEEIVKTDATLNGKRITYDALQKMTYLDQVISETLRKWTPTGILDRKCVKNYEFESEELNLKFTIEKDSILMVPHSAIHHDEKYYPEPEKFDPERFSDDRRNDIAMSTYMPFGIGPRNCIGSRFALMEIKALLYYLLLNFSFEANEKTEIPITLKKLPIVLAPKDGLFVDLKPRSAKLLT